MLLHVCAHACVATPGTAAPLLADEVLNGEGKYRMPRRYFEGINVSNLTEEERHTYWSAREPVRYKFGLIKGCAPPPEPEEAEGEGREGEEAQDR